MVEHVTHISMKHLVELRLSKLREVFLDLNQDVHRDDA